MAIFATNDLANSPSLAASGKRSGRLCQGVPVVEALGDPQPVDSSRSVHAGIAAHVGASG